MKYMSAEQAGKCGRFIKLPCAIFDSRLSPLAKLLYAYLLNLSTLSAKNGLSDERGVYVFCTLEQASEMLDCSRNTARKHFKQLDEQGLIKRQFRDGEAFRIYLPDPSNLTPSNLDESNDCPLLHKSCPTPLQKTIVPPCKICPQTILIQTILIQTTLIVTRQHPPLSFLRAIKRSC